MLPRIRKTRLSPLDAFVQSALDVLQGCEQKIPQAVPPNLAALLEPVVDQSRHQSFGIGQRGQAASNVARRDQAHIPTKPAGTAAVVGNRHDGREIGSVLLEAAEQYAHTRAAADSDRSRAAAQPPAVIEDFGHVLTRRDDDAENRLEQPKRAQRRNHHSHHPNAQFPPGVRYELQRNRVDDRAGGLRHVHRSIDESQEHGERKRRQDSAKEDKGDVPLDAYSQGQPLTGT